jgi:PAS domain S-box-containing protein
MVPASHAHAKPRESAMTSQLDDPGFRLLAEAVSQVVWVADASGGNVYFNRRWVDYTGLSLADSRDHGWLQAVHPDDAARAWQSWQRARLIAAQYSDEVRIRSVGGTYRWWQAQAIPLLDEGGLVHQWFGTCTDIDDLKQAHATAPDTKAALEAALQCMADAVLIVDAHEHLVASNDAYAEYHRLKEQGRKAASLADCSALFDLHSRAGETVPFEQWPIVRALRGEAANNLELMIQDRETGEKRVGSYNFAPIRGKDGRIIGAVCATRDVTQARELEELLQLQTRELLKALDDAESSNRAKGAFLRMVSHELRTPLNAIIGFSGLLLDGIMGDVPENQRKPLSIINESGQQLLELIRGILDVTNIEAGNIRVESVPVHLQPLIAEQCDSLRPQATARGLVLRHAAPDNDIVALGDRLRIGQVLRNLLENAIKFTDAGSIEVRASISGGLARIDVEDTGIGVAADQQSRIFRRFERVEDPAARIRPGSGLGLDICSRIVEAMGGTIGVDSELGHGSRFWFTLPLPE